MKPWRRTPASRKTPIRDPPPPPAAILRPVGGGEAGTVHHIIARQRQARSWSTILVGEALGASGPGASRLQCPSRRKQRQLFSHGSNKGEGKEKALQGLVEGEGGDLPEAEKDIFS